MTPETTAPTYVKVPGMGALKLRGWIWWIRYSDGTGRPPREESSKSGDVKQAEKLLRLRIQELGKNERIDPTSQAKVTMASLFDDLLLDYQTRQNRSLDTLGHRLKPLRRYFDALKARDVNGARVARYQQERLKAGKAPATVNRECAALRRAFSIGVRNDRIAQGPKFEMLPENNVREGFADPGAFDQIVGELSPRHDGVLPSMASLGYVLGWRSSELKGLSWEHIDRTACRITCSWRRSKNGKPRTIRYRDIPEVVAIIERRVSLRALGCPWVFHRNGNPVKDFRGAWRGACERAGHAGLRFHDLRRSATRNLTDAGIDQGTAMQITGHLTASIFQRYNIRNEDNIAAALARVVAHNQQAPRSNVVPLRKEATG